MVRVPGGARRYPFTGAASRAYVHRNDVQDPCRNVDRQPIPARLRGVSERRRHPATRPDSYATSRFEEMYDGSPPWETGRPQPAFVRLFEQGLIGGEVLDVGCGTGENAIFFAQRGLNVTGVDAVEKAIESARCKARDRGVNIPFLVHDALDLLSLNKTFDTVIDSGLFHCFSDHQRIAYVNGLGGVLRAGGLYLLMCFYEHETREGGPRRVTQAELRQVFVRGWSVERVEPATFEAATLFDGGAKAWLAIIRRA